MTQALPAGSVAVSIIGIDKSIREALQRTQAGFKGMAAVVRDTSVTFYALDRLARQYVINPLKSAITDLTTFGDTYAKMSRRVGMGAKDLSLLGYAAEQSGASVSALGDGMRYLNRNLALAGQGSKAAQDAFSQLGINSNRLQTLGKKEQFLVVADAIRRLGDEAKQTDAAMKLFGRGGTSMLPMLQEGASGIRKLMQEADDLGIGISDQDAANAEILSSSITRLQRSFQGLRQSIVSGLVKPVTQALDWGTKITQQLREWVNANQKTVDSIVKIGKVAVLTGAAFATWKFVAPVIFGITKAVFGLTLAILKTTAAVLLSPWGLLAVAIVGATGAVLYFTGAFEGFFASFTSGFNDIIALIKEGRIIDAVKMLWLQIQLLYENGKLALYNTWTSLVNSTAKVLLSTWWAVASGIDTVWGWLQKGWNTVITGMQVGFLSSMKFIVQAATIAFDTLFRIAQALAGALGFTISNPIQSAVAGIDAMIDGVRDRAQAKALSIGGATTARQEERDQTLARALNVLDSGGKQKSNARIEGLKREIAELKKPLHKPGEKSRQITETAQHISQRGASSLVQGTMNKRDILGGALAYMASEKDRSEDIADNTSKTNDLLTELNRCVRNGAMRYK